MQLETHDEGVSSLVREAVAEIEAYKDTKDIEVIRSATARLEDAVLRDPQYVGALYYRGVAWDLLGRASDAIPDLERVLGANPPFADEVHYHLGVAYYHRYNRESLERAIEHLGTAARETGSPILRLQARAVLTQAHAMRMLQPNPQLPDLDDARRYFDLSLQEYATAIKEIGAVAELQPSPRALHEITGTLENAIGMAMMYSTDYFGNATEKVVALEEALTHFERANRSLPNDWANYCDRGSAHMRLGHWTSEVHHFDKALASLQTVVQSLRPHYGFALYEIGRTLRLMGRFTDAIAYFETARKIPYNYRDVSDRRVDFEHMRASTLSKDFP